MKTQLILALGLTAMAGLSQAASIPPNIQLTPYCDTLHNMTVSSGVVTGQWDSDCDGTAETQMGGPTGVKLSGVLGKGYAMATDTYPLYGVTEEMVIHADGTWVILFANGGTLASGTWTPIAEGVKPTGKAINAK